MSLEQSRRREDAVQRLATHLVSVVDGMDEASAFAVLAVARVTRLRALHELDAWMDAHPDALAEPGAHCPLSLVRLAHALHAAGHTDVVLPACVACGRTLPDLVTGPDGRICGRCAARMRIRACVRCGREGRILARRAEGGICHRCYRVDEQVITPCARCGRPRQPVARLDDGSPVCETCWQPVRTCTTCGTTGPTHYRGSDGPLCPACYRRRHQPQRACSRCGEVARIAHRGQDPTAEVCYRCYRPPTVDTLCATCGRARPCRPAGRSGPLTCSSCRPLRRVACARCARVRIVAANWPVGPICHPCYQTVLRDTRDCARCGIRRPLVGRDETTAAAICGPCAGTDIGHQCRTCGNEGRIYAEGQCTRCVLRTRLVDLLTGPAGGIEPQLVPVLETLSRADRPEAVIKWLAHSPAARLLAQLAAHGRPISHDDLDAVALGHGERYARHLLTHTGVLPHRHDDIERVEVWLDRLLTKHPAHHARLVRPFAIWHLLRRARRAATRRTPTSATGERLRSHVRVALDLLDWIDARQVTLAALTQPDLEQWLAEGARRRHTVRHFLNWATERGLTPPHEIPTPPQRDPGAILDDDRRWHQLRRCLTDEQLPDEVRVAGALILLYGLTVSRIRQLTTTHITIDNGQTFLTVGAKPLPLPPSLGELTQRLAQTPRSRSALASGSPAQTAWLFPGLNTGQPLTIHGLGKALRRHGITTRPARHAALIALAGELPTPILAETLGIHINTARRWAGYLQRDWSTYLAERASPDTPTVPPTT
ncbi:hypothetical protein ACN27F_03725 [Solwaraspora sp. WMMB335]|uniref:hypothetical protein n=1 Tax=Solwaraspora sp. WMMB335 TaxID=3404118 RepID=UPI003B949981